jgi:hypothetical protein
MSDFISNVDLLDESVSKEDYFNLDEQISSLSQKIDTTEKTSMIGIVADYGKGKSTLIEQVRQKREGNSNETWVEFEAWKVPERKEMWETFVIDLARQINAEEFSNAINNLDGKQNDDKKTLINTIGDIPGLSVIKNFSHFLETSPATRVFEIQEILKGVIEKFEGDTLVLVVEDVDRSGEYGIYFIETLRQFLREMEDEINKKFVILLPIAESSFVDKEESYLKCLDIVEFFDYKEQGYETFFEKVLKEPVKEGAMVKKLSDFFTLLSREYPNTTMRKIKLITRKAMISHKLLSDEGYEPDWRVCIAFASARHFQKEGSDTSELQEFVEAGEFSSSSIFGKFLYVLSNEGQRQQLIRHNGIEEVVLENAPQNWRIFTRPDGSNPESHPSTPYFPSHDRDERGIVLDFYLRH